MKYHQFEEKAGISYSAKLTNIKITSNSLESHLVFKINTIPGLTVELKTKNACKHLSKSTNGNIFQLLHTLLLILPFSTTSLNGYHRSGPKKKEKDPH